MADAEILVETLPAVGHAQTVDDEVVRPDSHAQTEGEADAGDRGVRVASGKFWSDIPELRKRRPGLGGPERD
jgi:hypothetical protein